MPKYTQMSPRTQKLTKDSPLVCETEDMYLKAHWNRNASEYRLYLEHSRYEDEVGDIMGRDVKPDKIARRFWDYVRVFTNAGLPSLVIAHDGTKYRKLPIKAKQPELPVDRNAVSTIERRFFELELVVF